MTEYNFMGNTYRVGDEIVFYNRIGGEKCRGVINKIETTESMTRFLFNEVEVIPLSGSIYVIKGGAINPEDRDWIIIADTVELI